MTHEDCLNLMLANACPSSIDNETCIGIYYLEAHCVVFKVTAKLISTGPNGIKYEIINVEMEDC